MPASLPCILPSVCVEGTCTCEVSARYTSNTEGHVLMGTVSGLCLSSGDFSAILHSLGNYLCRILFSGVICSVYVLSHFDYCTHLWSHCMGKTKIRLQIFYSSLGLDIGYCIPKIPFYLLERHMHKDIVLESILFTLDINIWRIYGMKLLTFNVCLLIYTGKSLINVLYKIIGGPRFPATRTAFLSILLYLDWMVFFCCLRLFWWLYWYI